MCEYLNNHKKLKYSLYGFVVILVIFTCIWYYAVTHVVDIFNAIASKQPIFKGKIHAEELDANFEGNIVFKNLNWTTDDGKPIVKIPFGKLSVRPMDVLTLNVSPNTIRMLELNKASIRLSFDEKWGLDIIQQDWKHEQITENTSKDEQSEKVHKNLNLPEKLPNWKVIIKDCAVEAYRMNNHYVMKDVNCNLEIRDHSKVKLDFSSGPLSGTMQGAGIVVKGDTDYKANITKTHVDIKEVVPASLGVGKLTNDVTISCDFTGPADDPVLDGIIKFKTLNIRPFVFTNVSGKFHSVGEILDVTDTTGNCCGGRVYANGKYNLISRRYKIQAYANNVDVGQLVRRDDVQGKADLDFQILTDPVRKDSVIFGNFKIGKGKAKHGHFHSVDGEVFAHKRNIYFRNVLVKMGIGHIHNHAFSIENGKFNDNPVFENEAGIIADLSRI